MLIWGICGDRIHFLASLENGPLGELHNESLIALRLMAFYLLESSSELEFFQIKKAP
jgi:hypothetical protein